MTTELVLTEEQTLKVLSDVYGCSPTDVMLYDIIAAAAIQEAVLNSPEIQALRGIARCGPSDTTRRSTTPADRRTVMSKQDVVSGYEDLARVLNRALEQAQRGKGHERHGGDLPFNEQPMQRLCDLYGRGFALGQAGKKLQEAQRMDKGAAANEMLGAIVYIAGALIHLENENGQHSNPGETAVGLLQRG